MTGFLSLGVKVFGMWRYEKRHFSRIQFLLTLESSSQKSIKNNPIDREAALVTDLMKPKPDGPAC